MLLRGEFTSGCGELWHGLFQPLLQLARQWPWVIWFGFAHSVIGTVPTSCNHLQSIIRSTFFRREVQNMKHLNYSDNAWAHAQASTQTHTHTDTTWPLCDMHANLMHTNTPRHGITINGMQECGHARLCACMHINRIITSFIHNSSCACPICPHVPSICFSSQAAPAPWVHFLIPRPTDLVDQVVSEARLPCSAKFGRRCWPHWAHPLICWAVT